MPTYNVRFDISDVRYIAFEKFCKKNNIEFSIQSSSEQSEDKDDLRKLIDGSFGIAANANDFFNFACAQMVLIYSEDLDWVIPIFKKYSWKGLDACMAYIAKQMPLKSHITKEFEEAYAEIEKLNPKVHSEY